MPGESFEAAAENWLKNAQIRNRRPIRPTTVPSLRCAMDKWLIPHLGKLPLSNVHNGSVKHLVAAMQKAKLSPKTISTYVNMVKTIVASVIDEESGEPVFMRRWNATVLDMPVIENQRQPCLSAEEIELMLDSKSAMLYVLLASTGLRISEALGLEKRHIVNDWRTLVVEQQVGRFGKIVPYAKTKAGIRQVDLHTSVAHWLKRYVVLERRQVGGGLLFPTREGTPQLPRNMLRALDTDKGFHSFRRFRETHLSEMGCNHDIKIYWMGHKPESMSELYSKIGKRADARLAEAERVGIGFALPDQIVKVA